MQVYLQCFGVGNTTFSYVGNGTSKIYIFEKMESNNLGGGFTQNHNQRGHDLLNSIHIFCH